MTGFSVLPSRESSKASLELVVQFVKSVAMRALLHLMLMAMASHALRDMQGATELSHAKAEKDVEGSEQPDGKCMAKPEHQSHKGVCAFSSEKFVCDSQRLFCDWYEAKKVPPHCEGKAEHPGHKGLCDINRNEEMVCKQGLGLFCDWVPEKVEYVLST